jgi:hypothetical protein
MSPIGTSRPLVVNPECLHSGVTQKAPLMAAISGNDPHRTSFENTLSGFPGHT